MQTAIQRLRWADENVAAVFIPLFSPMTLKKTLRRRSEAAKLREKRIRIEFLRATSLLRSFAVNLL
jgi:hypothetical protein